MTEVSSSVISPSYCLGHGLSLWNLGLTISTRQAGQRALQPLSPQLWNYRYTLLCPGFNVGAEVSNLRPHAYTASTLLFEPLLNY